MGGGRRLRVCTVGAGYFSRFHHDGWRRIERTELLAVCDLDRGKAEAMARAFGTPRAFDDAAAMLDACRPDLVDIVTPPATHAALVGLAAERGIDVVCQKPLAPSLEEARALVATAQGAGIRLIVHENFRFQPWYREARRLLRRRPLGTPHDVAFRLRPGDGQGPDAYRARQPYFQEMERFLVHETAIHLIDTFRYLFGEIEAVFAWLRRLNPAIAGEDAGYILFRFASGAAGLFDGNRLNEHVSDELRRTMGEMWLEGSAGVLRLDGEAASGCSRTAARSASTFMPSRIATSAATASTCCSVTSWRICRAARRSRTTPRATCATSRSRRRSIARPRRAAGSTSYLIGGNRERCVVAPWRL